MLKAKDGLFNCFNQMIFKDIVKILSVSKYGNLNSYRLNRPSNGTLKTFLLALLLEIHRHIDLNNQ